MLEVTIRIRFNRECLGSAKRRYKKGHRFYMPRSPSGRVMFLPNWWQSLMQYAAKVANQRIATVRRIDWDPCVEGECTGTWKRLLLGNDKKPYYAIHEAFHPGDVIGVNAILPDGLTIPQFQELLEIAGTYRGISPYQRNEERFGTFEVLSVRRTGRGIPDEEITPCTS